MDQGEDADSRDACSGDADDDGHKVKVEHGSSRGGMPGRVYRANRANTSIVTMRRVEDNFERGKCGHEKKALPFSPYILPQYRESIREREGERGMRYRATPSALRVSSAPDNVTDKAKSLRPLSPLSRAPLGFASRNFLPAPCRKPGPARWVTVIARLIGGTAGHRRLTRPIRSPTRKPRPARG